MNNNHGGGEWKPLNPEIAAQLMSRVKPMSRREYEAIRVNIGCLNACRVMCEALEERLRECIPYGWRDARMLESRWRTLFDKLLCTIPPDKLLTLKRELPYYELYVRMKGAAKYSNDEHDYVMLPRTSVMALAEAATQVSCPLCDKKGKEIKRCKLRRLLDDCLPYNVPLDENKDCPFSDYAFDRMELEELEEL